MKTKSFFFFLKEGSREGVLWSMSLAKRKIKGWYYTEINGHYLNNPDPLSVIESSWAEHINSYSEVKTRYRFSIKVKLQNWLQYGEPGYVNPREN